MARVNDPPETIAKIIDEIDRVREELFTIQKALEKLEVVKSIRSKTNGGKARKFDDKT
jgi:ubiquinone biosynthesis protein UbiJ